MAEAPSFSIRNDQPTELVQRGTYNVDEVAKIMGLSRAGTYALVRSGDIPAIRCGNRWLIPRRRFHSWLDGEGADAQ